MYVPNWILKRVVLSVIKISMQWVKVLKNSLQKYRIYVILNLVFIILGLF